MQTIQVREKTGTDGVLNLRIPLGVAETECEVVIVVQPQTTASQPTPEELGWPPGYFEQTFGSITDETFVRHPQLVTHDTNHFGRVPGLLLENWELP